MKIKIRQYQFENQKQLEEKHKLLKSYSHPVLLNDEIKKALSPTPLKLIYPQSKKVKLPTFKVIKFKKYEDRSPNKNDVSKTSVTTLSMPANCPTTTKNV